MKRSKVVVVGSSNTDIVINTQTLPLPGETVLGNRYQMSHGGKGGNQAVAASRLGAEVALIARVGADMFGKSSVRNYEDYGIDTSAVHLDWNTPSGLAMVTVDDEGQNLITVATGANSNLSCDDIDQAEELFSVADFVLIQLEIPDEVVYHTLKKAHGMGIRCILNPAPAHLLPDDIFECISIITPNQREAKIITGIEVKGIDSARNAAKHLFQKGIETVIITMGEQGAYVYTENIDQLFPTDKVTATDTTAAGDVFNGALVAALGEDMPLEDAVMFANKAASISVTRFGAQSSIPKRHELDSAPVH